MNTSALATPASRRCASKGAAAVKNPLSAMNSEAPSEPAINSPVGDKRRISHGVASAPMR